MEKYYSLEELLEIIEEPNRGCCKKIFEDNKDKFINSKGSSIKHQAWKGGYLDHITETFNIAFRLYSNLNNCRSLPFSLSDVLLILFLHDLEKPWKYSGTEEEKNELRSFDDYKDFIKSKILQYGFEFTEEHWNALKYIHGEGEDYDPKIKIQGPLAAFVHSCDTISARIWFDYPNNGNNWQ